MLLNIFLKNGVYIHFLHAFLYHTTGDIYISSIIAIKLYSTNYFYWYGNHFNYLPRHNWVKQFIRFTDTGHLASVLPLFYPQFLPVAHNIHFIIMSGYWIGKLAFGVKDADKLVIKDNIEWHTDLCTYIHHSVPYALIHYLFIPVDCINQYSYETIESTYLWLYAWFIFIYIPWRKYTGDPVYSILDTKQTPRKYIFGFVFAIHLLTFFSNYVGYTVCKLYPNHIA